MRKIFKSYKMCENFSDSISRVMAEIKLQKWQKENLLLKNSEAPLVTNRPFTVVVEGNIGSGKTTFLQHFNKFSEEVEILAEPVDKWRNANGHNLLQMMYEDPHRYLNHHHYALGHHVAIQVELGLPDLCPVDHGPEPYQGHHQEYQADGEVLVLSKVLLRGEPEEERQDAPQ